MILSLLSSTWHSLPLRTLVRGATESQKQAPKAIVATAHDARLLAIKSLGQQGPRQQMIACALAFSTDDSVMRSAGNKVLHQFLGFPWPSSPPASPHEVNDRYIKLSQFLRGSEAFFFLSTTPAEKRDAVLTDSWNTFVQQTAAHFGPSVAKSLCQKIVSESQPKSEAHPSMPIKAGRLSETAALMSKHFS